MSLRLKIIGIITFGFIALSGAVFLYTHSYVEKAFTGFEMASASADAQFVGEVYDRELEAMIRYAEELARLPEVREGGEDYGDGYFPVATEDLHKQKVSFVALVDNRGEMVASRRLNLASGQAGELPKALQDFIHRDNHLRIHQHADSLVRGLVMLEDSPMLAVSVPILPAKAGGLINGAVILGREWAHSEFAAVANRNGMIVFHQRTDGTLSSDMKAFYQQHPVPGATETRMLGDHSIATYANLADIYERPVLIVRLTKNREGVLAAMACAVRVALFSLGAGLVLFVLMMVLLEATVLRRLRTLVRQVHRLKVADHPGDAEITVRGGDEVGKIAHGMRYLLDAMKTNKYRWLRAEKRLQDLLEHSPMGMLLADPVNHRLYRINDAALKILAADRQKLTGKTLRNVFVSINGKKELGEVLSLAGDDFSEMPATIRRADGGEANVVVKVGAFRQNEGETLLFAFLDSNGNDAAGELQ